MLIIASKKDPQYIKTISDDYIGIESEQVFSDETDVHKLETNQEIHGSISFENWKFYDVTIVEWAEMVEWQYPPESIVKTEIIAK